MTARQAKRKEKLVAEFERELQEETSQISFDRDAFNDAMKEMKIEEELESQNRYKLIVDPEWHETMKWMLARDEIKTRLPASLIE